VGSEPPDHPVVLLSSTPDYIRVHRYIFFEMKLATPWRMYWGHSPQLLASCQHAGVIEDACLNLVLQSSVCGVCRGRMATAIKCLPPYRFEHRPIGRVDAGKASRGGGAQRPEPGIGTCRHADRKANLSRPQALTLTAGRVEITRTSTSDGCTSRADSQTEFRCLNARAASTGA
jgi:hypothetical protein